jgi:2-polyprenyl-6-methoxyphenol hydroxylase-like FAD-dependent oxidoreductase
MGKTKAIIVGAGIGGLSAAVTLRHVGIDVEVWEQAEELRSADSGLAGTGLAVMSNAIAALQALGLDLRIGEDRGVVIKGLELMSPKGKVLAGMPTAEAYQRLGAPTVCIHRGELQAALLEAAAGAPIRLGARATGFEVADDGRVRVRFGDGREARGDLLIGADGISSAVRAQLHGAASPRYGGFFCWLATIPFEDPRMIKGFSRQYWGQGRRFGLNDMGQGRAYWWASKTMPKHAAGGKKASRDELRKIFAGWAPETRAVMEATPEEAIVCVPAQDRPFLDRWGTGPVTLLGDAAHPMLMAYSQGGSTAIEDAVVLAMALRSAPDVVSGLRAYENLRRERTRWLVDSSYRLGQLEQFDNPVLAGLRNLLLRLTPPATAFRSIEKAMTWAPPAVGTPRVPTAADLRCRDDHLRCRDDLRRIAKSSAEPE